MSRTLVPVMGPEGCIGHLLATCRGWRACDSQDRELGYFETEGEAVVALQAAKEDRK